jgi:tRNA G18 (ribose-2'-O)-methylase SpoU
VDSEKLIVKSEKRKVDVVLYGVGRNLNRAYRTCEAFGVRRLKLLDCRGVLRGNLFKAAGRVEVLNISGFPQPDGLLALETYYPDDIYDVRWDLVSAILIGGETGGLPRKTPAQQRVHIPMVGKVSGLTVESALAIALYEWRRNEAI